MCVHQGQGVHPGTRESQSMIMGLPVYRFPTDHFPNSVTYAFHGNTPSVFRYVLFA